MRKVIEHCKTSTVHVSVMYVCFRCVNKVFHLKKKIPILVISLIYFKAINIWLWWHRDNNLSFLPKISSDTNSNISGVVWRGTKIHTRKFEKDEIGVRIRQGAAESNFLVLVLYSPFLGFIGKWICCYGEQWIEKECQQQGKKHSTQELSVIIHKQKLKTSS